MKNTMAAQHHARAVTAKAPASINRVLVCLALSTLLSSLGTSIANVGLPTLAEAFSASFQSVQWIVLAYLLAITTLIVGVGRLGDLVGRRRLLLAGLLLFAAASVLCGVAPTLSSLIATRAVQGLGAAIMMSLAMAFVGDTVPKTKLGGAMGLMATMSAVGTALGPSLGGVLIAGFGWRALFLVNAPLALLAFVLALWHLPVDRRQSTTDRPGFDIAGTVLLMMALAAYAAAMTAGHGIFGVLNLACLLMAIIAAWLFVRTQATASSPLIRLSALRGPTLGSGLAMSTLVATVMMATLVVGPFHLSGALGLDAATTGLVMSLGPLFAAMAGVPAGRMADRFGARRMTAIGIAAMLVGCIALSASPLSLGVVAYIVPMILLTVGYALFMTANNTAVMADVAGDQRGVISGVLSLSRNLGLITGASLMGAVFAHASSTMRGVASSAEATAIGMKITFALAALLTASALVLALRGRAPQKTVVA